MDTKTFQSIIPYKIQDVVGFIMKKEKTTFLKAVHKFYSSQCYNFLVDEKSKYWHLSTPLIFEILKNELKTGTIQHPDWY